MSLDDIDTIISRIKEASTSSFEPLINELRNGGVADSESSSSPLLPVQIPSMRIDELANVLCSAISDSNGRMDAWIFFDFMLKNSSPSELLMDALQPEIIMLCTQYAYKQNTVAEFKPIADSLKLIFGMTIGALLTLKLKGAEKFAPTNTANNNNNTNNTNNNQDAAQNNNNSDTNASGNIGFSSSNNNNNTTGSSTTSGGALVVHKAMTSIGGFAIQTQANNRRDMGHAGALQVKTRDSMKAINQAAMYAPAAPSEIALQHIPERERGARIGFMSNDFAEKSAASTKLHISQRQEKLKNMFKKMREKEEESEGNSGRRPNRDDDGNFLPPSNADDNDDASDTKRAEQRRVAQALHGDDIVLPTEFPRDGFGVKIGYFPEGVRFIRNAIRDCGGAIELTVLEQRIGQLVNTDVRSNFGDLRQFLHIHRPTFTVVDEENDEGQKQWIVRLTKDLDEIANDETGNAHTEQTWKMMTCPHCSRKLRGRNFARHEYCRKCIGVQIANAMRTGRLSENGRSPIVDLAAAAFKVMSTPRDDLDEDDVDFFATCTERAAAIPRFRQASEKAFLPIIKCLRVLRDRFLQDHGAASFDAVKLTEEDGVYARLFRIWGENLLRLPIPWIDTGDIIDIVHRFTNTVHRAGLPPPRAGDPRIQVTNSYPGFLLAESGTDVDDMSSDPEDELSDDEEPPFHFAPPVTPMETVMAAGIERETKKLTFKLHTAPPVLAQQVITQTDGSGTLRNVQRALGGK